MYERAKQPARFNLLDPHFYGCSRAVLSKVLRKRYREKRVTPEILLCEVIPLGKLRVLGKVSLYQPNLGSLPEARVRKLGLSQRVMM